MITLTTDFGDSEYAGIMKGVIYTFSPRTQVVDLTHSIRKFDIRQAAYVLHTAARFFPAGTIHCVVVDPGVGTQRDGVIVDDGTYLYVGPDNGIFSFVNVKKVFMIKQKAHSNTFHGRDIFAPIAARIVGGERPEDLGTPKEDVVKLDIRSVEIKGSSITGEILCSDNFGNVITNIEKAHVEVAELVTGAEVSVKIGATEEQIKFVETYGDAKKGEVVCLIGSGGYLEIAVNRGSAAEVLGIKGGEEMGLAF